MLFYGIYVCFLLFFRFTVEVENFAKQVEALCKQTLSGPTPLDKEWRELGDEQEKISRQNSMAIARCYPMKNRFQDIMPCKCTIYKISLILFQLIWKEFN